MTTKKKEALKQYLKILRKDIRLEKNRIYLFSKTYRDLKRDEKLLIKELKK